jgi:PAS domain S-box-containing protein
MAKDGIGTAEAQTDKQGKLRAESDLDMLRILVDSIMEYAIIMLDPKGNMVSWSPAAERLKGYSASEVVGKNFSIFATPEDASASKTDVELKTAVREGRSEDEGWRVRKDGTKFWANVVITSLLDGEGTHKGFGMVTRDLSQRKEAEERIKGQAKEILEMATVIVQVWDGIILVPLIGRLDSDRTQQLMERLLQRLTETNSPVALIDITGVPTIDTQTAQHLIETIKAVRYIGSEVVLTGVRPAIAQTLVHLGIDLCGATTRSSLTARLRVAFEIINIHVARESPRGGGGQMIEGIAVLKVRDVLLVTMPADPDDATVSALQSRTLDAMEHHDVKGLILDLSKVEILDSYFARTVAETAKMVTLMGGETLIAGMRPSVAITATELNVTLGATRTVLTLDRALDLAGSISRRKTAPATSGHSL